MEITTEASGNNVIECSDDGKSETGMFGFCLCCILSVYLSVYEVFCQYIVYFSVLFMWKHGTVEHYFFAAS